MDHLVEASGKSFAAKYGKGFAMDAMINAARKIAGLGNSNVSYAPGYSCENCWRLIESLLDYEQAKDIEELSVVYLGNAVSKVQLWSMKEARTEDHSTGYMTKAFHAFIVQTPKADGHEESGAMPPSYVWDLDCTLPLPCRLSFYAQNVLRVQANLLSARADRMYRVVPASMYLKHFASDRVHMKLSDGSWKAEPPEWEPIRNEAGERSTIARYWDMHPPKEGLRFQDPKSPWGLLMDEHDFLNHYQVSLKL